MNAEKEKRPHEPRGYFMYDFAKATAAIPVLLWLRPRILYENEAAREHIRGGALVISNHVSFADPIAILAAIWYRRHHFICLKEFENKRSTKIFFKWFHCIPIDRENFGIDSFRQITGHLENGELVCMFPEGRINVDEGGLSTFKSGMVLMALKSNTPIVPLYLKPKKHWYSRMTIAIGEPVRVDAESGRLPSFDQINAASSRLSEKEEKLRELCI